MPPVNPPSTNHFEPAPLDPAGAPGESKSTALPSAGAPPSAKIPSELSPEEQMRRFEEDLKEHDWGHQPC